VTPAKEGEGIARVGRERTSTHIARVRVTDDGERFPDAFGSFRRSVARESVRGDERERIRAHGARGRRRARLANERSKRGTRANGWNLNFERARAAGGVWFRAREDTGEG